MNFEGKLNTIEVLFAVPEPTERVPFPAGKRYTARHVEAKRALNVPSMRRRLKD